jgi:AraC family transcriptional regulator, regulatory protein of adaptative response / methylated-DNA-[protein]-cysteine methyltransferase
MARRKTKGRASGGGIRYASSECTLGAVLVARTSRGVRAILLGDSRAAVEREARARFPGARKLEDDAELSRALADAARLVDGPGGAFDHALDPGGTEFQRRVWRVLREIPAGSTTTYARLAERLGAPRAARAVGSACGANPLAIAVPCHRVLRADGSLSGYRWGLRRKAELLRREAAAAKTVEAVEAVESVESVEGVESVEREPAA